MNTRMSPPRSQYNKIKNMAQKKEIRDNVREKSNLFDARIELSPSDGSFLIERRAQVRSECFLGACNISVHYTSRSRSVRNDNKHVFHVHTRYQSDLPHAASVTRMIISSSRRNSLVRFRQMLVLLPADTWAASLITWKLEVALIEESQWDSIIWSHMYEINFVVLLLILTKNCFIKRRCSR
jgi:hypothetical protein